MMKQFYFNRFLVAGLMILCLASCGGGSKGGGSLSLVVKNGRWPAGGGEGVSPAILKGETFRVVVSGSDFEPVESFVSGEEGQGSVTEIPVGENRTVLIEALNSTGRVVRRRTVRGVTISARETNKVEVELFSTPFVTNVSSGSFVTASRVTFEGYAEAGGGVCIFDGSSMLTDLPTNLSIVTPSMSDGSFVFQPQVLEPGPHLFRIEDPVTKEFQELELVLIGPGRMPGMSLGATGEVQEAGSSLMSVVTPGGGSADGLFPSVVEQIRENQ